jgi:hypothetical protein
LVLGRRRDDDRLECTPEESTVRRAEFERRLRIARGAPPGPVATLGNIRAGSHWMHLYCRNGACGHSVSLPLAPLIIRWGADAPCSRLRTGFRCTHGGNRETGIQRPSWGDTVTEWAPMLEAHQWKGTAVWPDPDPLSMHYLTPLHFGYGPDWHPVLGPRAGVGFALNDDTDDRPLFAFPGIWKRYRGPMKKDGEPVEDDVYAFMTTNPTRAPPPSCMTGCRCF